MFQTQKTFPPQLKTPDYHQQTIKTIKTIKTSLGPKPWPGRRAEAFIVFRLFYNGCAPWAPQPLRLLFKPKNDLPASPAKVLGRENDLGVVLHGFSL